MTKLHEIVDPKITAISLVRKGANRSKFVILKSDRGFERTVTFAKSAAAKQIAYAIVYEPGVADTQGDFATAKTIEKMAHDFVRNARMQKIDTEHDMKANGSSVVESFIARKGDPDFPAGAWVVGVHIPNRELWAQIVKGELTGFSMFGEGTRVERSEVRKSGYVAPAYAPTDQPKGVAGDSSGNPKTIPHKEPDNGAMATGTNVDPAYPLSKPKRKQNTRWKVVRVIHESPMAKTDSNPLNLVKDHSLDAMVRDAAARKRSG